MKIQCTRKLLDRLHVNTKEISKTSKEDTEQDFFSWHANLVTAERRKVLIFVNNRTRLAIIFHRPKPSDYKEIGKLLRTGIRELFSELGVRSEVIDLYMEKSGTDCITST